MNWALNKNLMAQLNLASPMNYFELAKKVSETWDQCNVKVQNEVNRTLKSNLEFQNLKKTRTLKKHAPFLRRYIKTNKTYNDLALHDSRDNNLPKAAARKIVGLCDEISASNTFVQGGTWLYYGLGKFCGGDQICLNHFLSLTFCPIIAGNHALRKAAVFRSVTDCYYPQKPTILAVQLQQNTKALFGNERELELIFPKGISLEVLDRYSSATAKFDILSCSM